MEEYTDVESQVEYGLEKIDPNRKIEVSLKDFLYLHNVVSELIRFFHQPLHYQTLEDVESGIDVDFFLNIHNLTNSKYWSSITFPLPERYFEGGVTFKY